MKNKTGMWLPAIIALSACIFLTAGCASVPGSGGVESWTHVIDEGNYREGDGVMYYRYEDPRFNTRDWYDVWMDDSHWGTEGGWSRFVDAYDPEKGMFMYGVEFYDGYIEFPAYGKELAGATLRFYRMPAAE